MPIDPRKLRPSELCRLLNSTPLGEVINERQVYRHRQRAGNRIGDGKTVDLLRYCAWMHVVRHTPKPQSDVDPYERMKESARARNAALALAGLWHHALYGSANTNGDRGIELVSTGANLAFTASERFGM